MFFKSPLILLCRIISVECPTNFDLHFMLIGCLGLPLFWLDVSSGIFKFVGHSTKIIQQSEIKGPLLFTMVCAPNWFLFVFNLVWYLYQKMALDLQMENIAICRSISKIISKLRDQISLRWQLTSVHSKFVGNFTEIIRQSKIKGPLTLLPWN